MFQYPTLCKSTSGISKEQNGIFAGQTIKSEIIAKGAFRVEYTLKENVATAGKVVLSKGGYTEETLTCREPDFEEKSSGELIVNGTLPLRKRHLLKGK